MDPKALEKNGNIVLIGMPSAGKTAVGSRLAALLGMQPADMDAELERRFGMSIAEYFARFGEPAFRAEEKKLAAQLALKKGLVIATGGGVVKDPDNMKCLGKSGTVIWLDRSPSLLRGTPDRPLSPDDESIRRLYKERLPLYERYADLRIDADGQPDEVCAASAKALDRYFSDNVDPFRPLLPPDKSLSHRALIAASLAGKGCRLFSLAENDDVKATADALKALEKLRTEGPPEDVTVIDCGESASTLRFLLPLFAQTGKRVVFTGKGRLLQRPLGAYEELYRTERTDRGIEVTGTLKPGKFTVPGNVSSQIVSGLLFLLPLLDKDSVIEILPPFESAGYVDMTLQVLKLAGIKADVQCGGRLIRVPGRQQYKPFEYTVPADWSAAANLAALAFLTGKEIDLSAADPGSAHPDRAITGFLEELKKGPIEADISGCPDLGPLLFSLATQTEGESRFTGTARLRLKESDRIASMQEELEKLGCSMKAAEDGTVLVRGKTRIKGGVTLSSHSDHRVAMALAVLASAAEKPVVIEGADCVSKSWPGFFETLKSCGAGVITGQQTHRREHRQGRRRKLRCRR